MCLKFQKWMILVVFLMTSVIAYACQVPVFRYALERWNADRYRVVVLHDGPLAEQHRRDLSPLYKAQGKALEQSGRVELTVVDVNQTKDPRLNQLWTEREDKSLPLLAAFYPLGSDTPANLPAAVRPLKPDNVAQLLSSPVRSEVEKRLLAGDSAVWIFVESGRPDSDRAAHDRLANQLAADEKWLVLPSAEELEVEPDVLTKAKIKLQIKFSIVTLQRDDPRESFLLDALLNSEADLRDFDEPLAFPVFGRGRVLYALIGRGIATDTIRAASSFMAGPCSCQVKNQNPGFDLLMMSDWDQAIGETLISDPIESIPDNLEPTLLTIPPGRTPSP